MSYMILRIFGLKVGKVTGAWRMCVMKSFICIA
jgi:hypothetical protein